MRKRHRWKVHQCAACETWQASGVKISAGHGKHRVIKFICWACKTQSNNERKLLLALTTWEMDHEPEQTPPLL